MLPTEPNKPCSDITRLKMLIYGNAGIGKSSFCSKIEGALFLDVEKGLTSLPVYKVPICSWNDARQAYKDIKESKHAFKWIIIDTIDELIRKYELEYCKSHDDKEGLGNYEWGVGYDAVKRRIMQFLTGWGDMPYGLILISHAREGKQTMLDGSEIDMIVPSLPNYLRTLVESFVDVIAYFHMKYDKETSASKRVIDCDVHDNYVTKDRTSKFRGAIPMDWVAFKALFKGGTK